MGSSMHRLSAATVASVLVPLALARFAAATPDGDLKALASAKLAEVKAFNKERFESCSGEIAIIEAQTRLNPMLFPPDFALTQAGGAAAGCLSDVLENAIDARAAVTAGAVDVLIAAGDDFPGFVVGDGGLLDQFFIKVNADLEKFRRRVEKRVRGHIAFLRKFTSDGFRSSLVLPPLRLELAPAPNKPSLGTNLPNHSQPLRILAAVAGSSRDIANDGSICIFGRAFVTDATERVNVLFDAPGGPYVRVDETTAADTGRWNSCFIEFPEGNVRVLVDQDPNHDAVFFEAATEFVAIGVP